MANKAENKNLAKDATAFTREANAAWYKKLDFDDEAEKENALRGLLEAPTALVIRGEDGHVVWNAAGLLNALLLWLHEINFGVKRMCTFILLQIKQPDVLQISKNLNI